MAKSKDDIRYGAAQAKVSEEDALRIRYKAGTPLEGGKIADSEPIDLFQSAHNISRAQQQQRQQQQQKTPDHQQQPPSRDQSQSRHHPSAGVGGDDAPER